MGRHRGLELSTECSSCQRIKEPPFIKGPPFKVAVGNSTAAAINNAGQIAGFYTDAAGNFHGFIDIGRMFTTLDAAGAMDTSLLGLNNFGEAVGFDVDAAGLMHGVVCNTSTLACTEVDDPNGIGTTTFNGVNDRVRLSAFM